MALILKNMSGSDKGSNTGGSIGVTGSLHIASAQMGSGASARQGGIIFGKVGNNLAVPSASGSLYAKSANSTTQLFWFDGTTATNLTAGSSVDGSGAASRVTYWTDPDTVSYSDKFRFDGSALLSRATTIDWQGSGDVNLDSSAGSIAIGTGSADGQTLKLGRNGAVEMVFTPHGTAATEKWSLTNTAGDATDAIAITATAGGVDVGAGTVLALDGTTGINIGVAADAPIDIDSTTLDIDASGAITIDGTSTIGIGSAAAAGAINIGTNATARTVTMGNVTGATAVALNAGTGGIALASTGDGDITLNSDDTLLLDSDGVLELNSSSGAISVGNDAVALDLNFGSGAATGTIQVGNAARTAANVDALAVTVTSVNALSVTDGAANLAYDGAGAVTFTTVAYDHNASGAITIDGTSTISIDGAGALNIDTSSGALSVGTANSGIAVNIGHAVSETTVGDNLTVTGNLVVNGSTTHINTIEVMVEDKQLVVGVPGGMVAPGTATYTVSSNVVTVTSVAHGFDSDDYVLISDPAATSTSVVITEGVYQVTKLTADTFTFAFTTGNNASATAIDHSEDNVTDATATGSGILVLPASETKTSLNWSSSLGWLIGGPANATAGLSPLVAGSGALGGASNEWSAGYIGDGKFYFGAAQEHSVGDDNPGLGIDSSEIITIESSGGAISVGADSVAQAINVGTAGARTITVGNDASTKVDVNALIIELDSAGTIILDSTTTTVIGATTTMSVKGNAGASFGDDTGTWEFDGAGAVTETGMSSLTATPSGAITLTAGAASTWATSAQALTITSAAAATWSTTAGALVIDGGDGLTLDSNGTDAVNLGTEGVAKTITIGADESAKVDVNALIIELDSAASIVLNSVTTTDVDSTGILSLNSAAAINVGNDAVAAAINVGTGAAARTIIVGNTTGTTAVTLKSGTGDIALQSADAVTVDCAGVLTLDSSGGAISIGGDAVAAAINVGTGGAARTITVGNVTGATAVNLNAGTGGVTLASTGDGDITLNSSDTIALSADGDAITMDDGTTTRFTFNVDSTPQLDVTGNFILGGSGTVDINSAGAMTLDSAAQIKLESSGVTSDASVYPNADNTLDLGSSTYRWANIYTGDLHLANDRGNYTLVEEEEMLTIRNNRTGKWFKLMMEEIDPSGRDDGMQGVAPVLAAGPEWEI